MTSKEMTLSELTVAIEQWAEERGLSAADPRRQMFKLNEEFGELCGGLFRDKAELVKDAIGDVYVTMVVLSKQLGINVISNLAWGGQEEEKGWFVPGLDLDDYILMMGEFKGDISSGLLPGEAVDTEGIEAFIEAFLEKLNDVASELGYTLRDCVAIAYEEIKHRKGEMVNGGFVKDEDLQ